MKDNFSKLSQGYSQYRPSYPLALFEYLVSLVPDRKTAWDCGTGTGQVASRFAGYFAKVYATDISENQIKHAVKKHNIIYKIERAEKTTFSDNSFDLIAVAQAIHWFEFDKFYQEAERTLKSNGVIAVIGYSLAKVNQEIDEVVNNFYTNIIGEYWDKERKYVDEHYRTIPFPFNEIDVPQFTSEYRWSLNHYIGFLNTWSAVQHYIDKNNSNPIDLIVDDLEKLWAEDEKKSVIFPVLLRVGKTKNPGFQSSVFSLRY